MIDEGILCFLIDMELLHENRAKVEERRFDINGKRVQIDLFLQ